MKRKLLPMGLVLIALLLSACGQLLHRNEQATQPSTEPAAAVTDPSAEPVTEPPTSEPNTVPKDDSYLEQVKYAGFYIFTEPSFDGGIVQPLPVGTYTVVAEQTDDEENLWGKLKSGLGWICLTQIRANEAPVGIGEADETLLDSGKYTAYGDADTQHAIPMAIQAVEDLTNVTVSAMDMGDDGMVAGEALVTKTKLPKDSYLVVWVEFPGDMTTYEVTFTDSTGTFHRYHVSTSGRNSGLTVWEQTR